MVTEEVFIRDSVPQLLQQLGLVLYPSLQLHFVSGTDPYVADAWTGPTPTGLLSHCRFNMDVMCNWYASHPSYVYLVVAHELRHVWQARTYGVFWYLVWDDETMEQDAYLWSYAQACAVYPHRQRQLMRVITSRLETRHYAWW